MDMCYDGALVMPSSYAVMDEEEMTYVEGGYWYSKAHNNFTGKEAYKCMIEGRNSSYALLSGSIGAGAIFGNIAGAAIGAGVGSFVFGQWADAYASAAEKLYKFRNSTSKYFSWIEAVSGVFHLSHEFTKWAK